MARKSKKYDPSRSYGSKGKCGRDEIDMMAGKLGRSYDSKGKGRRNRIDTTIRKSGTYNSSRSYNSKSKEHRSIIDTMAEGWKSLPPAEVMAARANTTERKLIQ